MAALWLAEALRRDNHQLCYGPLSGWWFVDELGRLWFGVTPPPPPVVVLMPRSIPVRSPAYLRHKPPTNSPLLISSSILLDSAHLYVGSSCKGSRVGLELEVYQQGMYKTELCNKWQEKGVCGYGNKCCFAHGIGELRPVIRHPRYKTVICRALRTGQTCQYGHRCHFLHPLPADYRRLSYY